jgi:hypothetical protein
VREPKLHLAACLKAFPIHVKDNPLEIVLSDVFIFLVSYCLPMAMIMGDFALFEHLLIYNNPK